MEFNAGDVAYYHEEDTITKVKVISRDTDDRGVGYKLKALENIQTSRIFKDIEIGEEFTCWAAHNAGAYAGWHLLKHP